MKLLSNTYIFSLAILVGSGFAHAGAGALDPTFGQGGGAFYGPSDSGSCRRDASTMGIRPMDPSSSPGRNVTRLATSESMRRN